uniref:Lipid-binding serum glycoprotein N-terminal domain-containing protein n=1 Tax=Cuerna arida TaxID=1464854 RepID=A0A1B6G4J4_9HEMI
MIPHLLFLIVYFAFSNCIPGDYRTINNEIDELLSDYNKNILYDNLDTYHLQDIICNFDIMFGHKVQLFKATNGIARHMSTAKRTGDVTLTSSSTSLTIIGHLGLDRIEIVYKHSSVTSLFFSKISLGSFNVTVKKHSVGIQITLHFDKDKCVAVFDKVWLDYLDGLHVQFDNMRLFSKPSETFVNWIVKRLDKAIQKRIEDEFKEFVQKTMSEVNACYILKYISK